MGFIIMEPEDTPPMSGSNSICVATVLLETGIVPMQEPVTEMILEPPGGLIRIKAHCENGKVKTVTVRNVPSFVDRLEARAPGVPLDWFRKDVGRFTVVMIYADKAEFDRQAGLLRRAGFQIH